MIHMITDFESSDVILVPGGYSEKGESQHVGYRATC